MLPIPIPTLEGTRYGIIENGRGARRGRTRLGGGVVIVRGGSGAEEVEPSIPFDSPKP